MKIAMIAEGCYPYVTGGVASWIHQLMAALPAHDFTVLAVTAADTPPASRFPPLANLTAVANFSLTHRPAQKRPVRLQAADRELISQWLTFTDPLPAALDLFADPTRLGDADTFLASPVFYDMITARYQADRQSVDFLAYYWSWRNLLTPVLHLLQQPLPDRYDAVHATATGYGGLLAARIKRATGARMIITEHGIYAREREEDILQADWLGAAFKPQWIAFFHYLARTAYACADEVVTLSARNQQHQLAAGAAPDRLAVIPNGVPGADYAALPRHRFSHQALQIGAIVRLTPIKDIVTLIHACDYLRQANVPFHCTVMGPADEDPAYARRCRELIAALDLTAHITLTGKVTVTDYLPRLDVLVLTSISESQPLAMLEGMAAGLPWVTTNVGDCRELLTGPGDDCGPAGFVVRPIAPDQVAERLAWFYHHPDALVTMGAAGARRVLTRYQLTHMIAAYTDLYASA